MTADEAKRLMAKCGSQRKAAAAAGVSRKVIRHALAQGAPAKVSGARPVQGRTLSEFRSAYDKNVIVPTRVNAALRKLGNTWLYEVEFAKAAGVSMSDLAIFRDQYAAHVVSIKDSRRVWAGKAALAQQLREAL